MQLLLGIVDTVSQQVSLALSAALPAQNVGTVGYQSQPTPKTMV